MRQSRGKSVKGPVETDPVIRRHLLKGLAADDTALMAAAAQLAEAEERVATLRVRMDGARLAMAALGYADQTDPKGPGE